MASDSTWIIKNNYKELDSYVYILQFFGTLLRNFIYFCIFYLWICVKIYIYGYIWKDICHSR